MSSSCLWCISDHILYFFVCYHDEHHCQDHNILIHRPATISNHPSCRCGRPSFCPSQLATRIALSMKICGQRMIGRIRQPTSPRDRLVNGMVNWCFARLRVITYQPINRATTITGLRTCRYRVATCIRLAYSIGSCLGTRRWFRIVLFFPGRQGHQPMHRINDITIWGIIYLIYTYTIMTCKWLLAAIDKVW